MAEQVGIAEPHYVAERAGAPLRVNVEATHNLAIARADHAVTLWRRIGTDHAACAPDWRIVVTERYVADMDHGLTVKEVLALIADAIPQAQYRQWTFDGTVLTLTRAVAVEESRASE